MGRIFHRISARGRVGGLLSFLYRGTPVRVVMGGLKKAALSCRLFCYAFCIFFSCSAFSTFSCTSFDNGVYFENSIE